MAFHDTKTHGPMKQASIVTVVNDTTDTTIGEGFSEHDDKVSKFNAAHTVFFNQIAPSIRIGADRILITTVCLYADGASK